MPFDGIESTNHILPPPTRADVLALCESIIPGRRFDAREAANLHGAFLARWAEIYGAPGVDRLDAGETAVLAPRLQQIRARIQQRKRPQLKGRSLVKVTSEMDPNQETFTYEVWDSRGMAEMWKSPSDDIPKVGTAAQSHTFKNVAFALGYDLTIHEIERAAAARVPLRAAKMKAVDDGFELRVEQITATGVAGTNITGLLNHPNVPVINAPAAAGGGLSPLWLAGDKTPSEILDDLFLIEDTVNSQTKGVERCTVLALPRAHRRYINRTPLYTGAGSNPRETILSVFLEKSDGITRVEDWAFCELANAGGNGPRAVAYDDSVDVVHHEIPRERRELPPHKKSATVLEVVSDLVSAGVWFERPLAAVYLDGF